MIKFRFLLPLYLLLLMVPVRSEAQDDLLNLLEEEEETVYVTGAFKSIRVIGSHSLENVSAGDLDFRIMHRFGALKNGLYDIFGLDQATIRLGFDYGITDRLTVGFGRSSLYKELDGYVKYKLLWQSTGKRNMPVSILLVSGMTCHTLKWEDPDRENYFSSRLGYYHQLIIGRKFGDAFALQVSPLLVHRNIVELKSDKNDVVAVEMGARVKLSNRIAVTADYFYVLPDQLRKENTNPFSVGFDIETGGHVFQLHFTNAPAMNEKTFIADNVGSWSKSDIHFGFNISRMFTLSSK